MKTRLYFKGYIEADIDANPEEDEAWVEAISVAWGKQPLSTIGLEAQLVGHDIISSERTSEVETSA